MASSRCREAGEYRSAYSGGLWGNSWNRRQSSSLRSSREFDRNKPHLMAFVDENQGCTVHLRNSCAPALRPNREKRWSAFERVSLAKVQNASERKGFVIVDNFEAAKAPGRHEVQSDSNDGPQGLPRQSTTDRKNPRVSIGAGIWFGPGGRPPRRTLTLTITFEHRSG